MVGQSDGLRFGELLLERCPERDRARACAQISVAVLRLMRADGEGARSMLDEACGLGAELGDPELEGWARLFQGLAATLGGAGDAGRETLTQARDLHHELGVRIGEAKAIAVLGLIELKAGDPGRARELVEEALAIQLATGDLWSQGQCHTYLGIIAEANASDHAQATAHFG
jgi:hypothetical protein